MIRSFILLLLVIIMVLSVPQIVLGMSNPTTITIDVTSIGVYRSLLSSGDQVILLRYNVSYSTNQTIPATAAFKMGVLDSTGVLVSSRGLGWYGDNVMGLYLTPAQALTWTGNYSVRVYGDPAYFPVLTEGVNMRTLSISLGSWYESTSLGGDVLIQAAIVQALRGETLLTTTTLLNTLGSTYFLYAIPGLNSMLPGLFSNTQTPFSINRANFTNAYGITLNSRASPDLTAAVTSIGSLFGSNSNWTSGWIYALGFFVLMAVMFGATKQPAAGFIIGFPLVFLAAWIGLGTYWLTIGFIIFAAVVILFAILFLLGRLT